MDCNRPGFSVHHQLLELSQNHVHWVGDAIQPFHPLLSPSPSAFNLSHQNGLFKRVRWPKFWNFSFSISPSNEYSGLISFRMDWVDHFSVQDSQESSPTPQFKSINSSTLSLLYSPTLTSILDMTTGKTIALTRWIFVGKVMSLLFNMTFKLVMPSSHLFPLLSPSPPAFNLSQHQGLCKWVSSSHQVAKVLEFQL